MMCGGVGEEISTSLLQRRGVKKGQHLHRQVARCQEDLAPGARRGNTKTRFQGKPENSGMGSAFIIGNCLRV